MRVTPQRFCLQDDGFDDVLRNRQEAGSMITQQIGKGLRLVQHVVLRFANNRIDAELRRCRVSMLQGCNKRQ